MISYRKFLLRPAQNFVRWMSSDNMAFKSIIQQEIDMGMDLIDSKEYIQASSHLEKVLDQFKNYKGEKFYNVALQLLGDSYYYQRRFMDCDICYRNIVEIVEAFPENFKVTDVATAYSNSLSMNAAVNIVQA